MLIGGIICLLVFVVLLIALSLSGLQRFDELVTLKVIALRRPFITKIMLFFTKLGRATGVIIIIGALALVPPFRSAILKPAGLSLAIPYFQKIIFLLMQAGRSAMNKLDFVRNGCILRRVLYRGFTI